MAITRNCSARSGIGRCGRRDRVGRGFRRPQHARALLRGASRARARQPGELVAATLKARRARVCGCDRRLIMSNGLRASCGRRATANCGSRQGPGATESADHLCPDAIATRERNELTSMPTAAAAGDANQARYNSRNNSGAVRPADPDADAARGIDRDLRPTGSAGLDERGRATCPNCRELLEDALTAELARDDRSPRPYASRWTASMPRMSSCCAMVAATWSGRPAL